jgi:hypothetical protein
MYYNRTKRLENRLKRRFRIVEENVRGKSNFTVEYKAYKYYIFYRWVPIQVCETLYNCESLINKIVSIKLRQD